MLSFIRSPFIAGIVALSLALLLVLLPASVSHHAGGQVHSHHPATPPTPPAPQAPAKTPAQSPQPTATPSGTNIPGVTTVLPTGGQTSATNVTATPDTAHEPAPGTLAASVDSRIHILDASPLSSDLDTVGWDTPAPSAGNGADPNAAVVYVGMHIMNFERLDTKNGTFRFAGTLIAEWDPATLPPRFRLPATLKPPATGRTYVAQWKHWEPSLIMVNILADVTMGTPNYYLLSNGRVRAEVRFAAPSVDAEMDFSHFPFDTQWLIVQIAPDGHNDLPVRLEPLTDGTTMGPEVSLSEWDIKGLTSYSVMGNRVDFCVEVKRFWAYYVANIFLPMFIIAGISYCTMWVPRNNLPGALSLVGITIASLFLLKITVSSEIARMESMTYLDAIAVFHLITAASAASLNIIIARRWRNLPDPTDESPARLPRLIFPFAYLGGIVGISLFFWLL